MDAYQLSTKECVMELDEAPSDNPSVPGEDIEFNEEEFAKIMKEMESPEFEQDDVFDSPDFDDDEDY